MVGRQGGYPHASGTGERLDSFDQPINSSARNSIDRGIFGHFAATFPRPVGPAALPQEQAAGKEGSVPGAATSRTFSQSELALHLQARLRELRTRNGCVRLPSLPHSPSAPPRSV
jgi:hypothetical protein